MAADEQTRDGFKLPSLGPTASEHYAPIDADVRQKLLSVAVPTISAVLFQLGLRSRYFRGLRPLDTAKGRFCGAAWTLRAISVREDLRDGISARTVPSLNRMALDAAPAGCVIALGSGGNPDISFMGDIMTTALLARGVVGAVLDTGVSDASLVSEMALPVICAGRDAISSFSKIMVIGCNEAVDIQGVAVFPGDIIVGDTDGAVCIPRHMADDVAQRCIDQERLESFVIEKVRAGAPIDEAYPPNKAVLAEYRAWCDAQGDKA